MVMLLIFFLVIGGIYLGLGLTLAGVFDESVL